MHPSLPAFCLLRILGVLMTLVAAGGGLTACGAVVGGLRGGEEGAVAASKGSIVLLRFLSRTLAGEPVDFLGGVDFVNVWTTGQFIILVENIDTGEQTKTRPRSPTPEAAQEGWVYYVLAPGRYHVRTHPNFRGPVSGRFFLSVPAERAVIYAGSWPMTCRTPGGLGFLGNEQRGLCSPPTAVADESELAMKVSQASFGQYGPLTTILMRGPQ